MGTTLIMQNLLSCTRQSKVSLDHQSYACLKTWDSMIRSLKNMTFLVIILNASRMYRSFLDQFAVGIVTLSWIIRFHVFPLILLKES
jgi:hypothetical protein